MKKLLLSFFVLVSFFASATHTTLPLSGTGIYIPNATAYASYDTLFVDSSLRPSGVYTSFYMDSLFGTPTHIIYIVNKGKVTFSQTLQSKFKLDNGRYIVVTSALADQATQDGFVFTSPVGTRGGVGFEFTLRSKCITIQYVTSYNNGYCAWIKNELSCDSTLGNWVLDSIWLFHIYFHDNGQKEVGKDGTGQVYFGSTSPNALDTNRSILCGTTLVKGHIPEPLPSLVGHARVQYCVFYAIGRGGVYLNSAANGQSYITDNTFDSIGFNGELFQGVCIAAGGFSSVTIARNTFGRSLGSAIQLLGANLDSAYDNTSVRVGYLNGFSYPNTPTYFIDTRPIPRIPNDSLRVYFAQNVAGINNLTDIYVLNSYNGYYSTGNYICSNTKLDGSPADTSIVSSFHYSNVCSTPPPDTIPATPVPIPGTGTYLPNLSVSICCAVSGVTIYYTLDGSNPKTSGTRITYSSPFIIGASEGTYQLKCVAHNSIGYSDVDKETYTLIGGASIQLSYLDYKSHILTITHYDGTKEVINNVKKAVENVKKKNILITLMDGTQILK